MREVIFKAKSVETGEWAEGDLVHYVADTCIRVERVSHSAPVAKLDYIDIEVDPATVCQFTNIRDETDVRIFEGDRVEFEEGTTGVVEWEDCYMIIRGLTPNEDVDGVPLGGDDVEFTEDVVNTCRVTGSIHDSEATR